ncbi:hypothetical protein [Yoonia sp. I 8.24]|uniref:hypothetical protein n=1 Tax=Yoonia sp. I 8.24 TaxID=1537229 RepID=UPI001EDDC46E|nr:hypothetical protein [Yoonia sp. I 8.24]MCG3266749.1 hypothetical protein [Yoonia sp. I 8.24]
MLLRLFSSVFFLLIVPHALLAQQVDFGDNASEWAKDGRCDDPRFVGPGMGELAFGTYFAQPDMMHDAQDCRMQYEAGNVRLRGIDGNVIDFGDNASEFANNGECDDMRFEGVGMTALELLFADLLHDATDCRRGFESNRLTLVGIE